MKKSECYLCYYLFITLSRVCLEHSIAHMVDRQNAFADDDSGEPWVTSGKWGLRTLFPGWLISVAAVGFWFVPGVSA